MSRAIARSAVMAVAALAAATSLLSDAASARWENRVEPQCTNKPVCRPVQKTQQVCGVQQVCQPAAQPTTKCSVQNQCQLVTQMVPVCQPVTNCVPYRGCFTTQQCNNVPQQRQVCQPRQVCQQVMANTQRCVPQQRCQPKIVTTQECTSQPQCQPVVKRVWVPDLPPPVVPPKPGQPAVVQPYPMPPKPSQPPFVQPYPMPPKPGQPAVVQPYPVAPRPGQPPFAQPYPVPPPVARPVMQPNLVPPPFAQPVQPAIVQPNPAAPAVAQPMPGQPRAVERWTAQPPTVQRQQAQKPAARSEPMQPPVALSNDAQRLHAEVGKLSRAAKFDDAAEVAKRLLVSLEKREGREHPNVGTTLNNLALIYQAQGHFADAKPLFQRGLAIHEKALGPDHPSVGLSLNYVGGLYYAEGRLDEAEPFLRRSLTVLEKALGAGHRDVGQTLNNLASVCRAQGRLAEAEQFYRRSLAILEKAQGLSHPDVAASLDNLALLYWTQGRLDEAEPLFKRSLTLREQALGSTHPDVGVSLNNLASLYWSQARLAEGEPLFRRSLAILETALGPDHPNVGASLDNLGELHRAQNRLAEAEPLYRRGLAVREKALGPNHPDVGLSLNNLASLYWSQGRLAETEPLFQRSLAVFEKALGADHPNVGMSLNNLARLAYEQRDWARAAEYWRRSTGVIRLRAALGLAGDAEGSTKGEVQRSSEQFAGLVKATHRLVVQGRDALSFAAEMLETAQWAHASEAAASLAQMSARSATGSPDLARLVRERQDLVGERQEKDKLLIAAKGEPPEKRKAPAEKALADRLGAIDSRLAAINDRFAKDFPSYAALASPAPLSVAEVRAQIGADEALVLFLDTPEWRTAGAQPLPEESFVWVVTRSEVRWVRSELGTASLRREVRALRCGLDAAAWDGEGREGCARALGMAIPDRTPDTLSFDHARAHNLYMGLFGQVRDLIAGKHLLIVPSGALTQLPFQVLVREAPEGLTPVAWLARSHAVTVLPAVSSLKALRRVGRPSAAARPMIGFGNPLLTGDPGTKEHAEWARLAREAQRCRETPQQQVAALAGARSSVRRVELQDGLATLAHLKSQVPLPETAEELCTVARAVKAEASDIRLGSQATEREVKRLSAGGELAKYRMLHFATHGAVAGEIAGATEPGLILTPPEAASEQDDGYLSASEIAGLKLDADWVVLSACNTAAGGAESAEALSGLARAFIYAGARALLVSHWAVYSEATQKLVTAALDEMARDAKAGRAEALRRAMLALIDKGTPEEAHPAFWAPFVVVGEGAVR